MSTLLYNPDRKSKEQLLSEFVVRTQVYEEIMHDLETSKMKYPEQHYLLVGQRGAGKTTLLHRLKYGIEDSPKLKDKLIPVIFNEEQYNISELANLWESVGQFLEDYYGFEGIYNQIEKNIDKKNFEELSYDIIEKYLHKHSKKIILLIDNVGDILKKLDKSEVHRLREVLQTKKEIRLIAGSPFYLETILDYQQPLFEFFKVIRLDGLNEQETQNLLLKLGELHNEKDKIDKIINEMPERIETLRTLTGGVPRTIALMYRIFTDHNDESTVKDLERILDSVTPLYKHRMDDLPVQQQKIVDAVAKKWDAISVKELKEKVRIDSKNISAQLRQLEKNQVIEKRETGTKNHLYLLRERFFNIWYLMRYGRKDDKQRVIWLVRFLESWCNSEDINSMILNYIDKINCGKLDIDAINFYGNIYAAFTNIDPEVRLMFKCSVPGPLAANIIVSDKELIKGIKKYLKEENWDKILELAINVSTLDYDLEKIIYLSISALISKITKSNFYKILKSKIESYEKNRGNEEVNAVLSEGELAVFKNIFFHHYNFKLFSGKTEELFQEFTNYLDLIDEKRLQEKSFDYYMLTQFFCLILAKTLYNLLYKIFEEITSPPLKEIFKPVYYACVYLTEGNNSLEFLRAGPEIQGPIQNILEVVKRLESQIAFKGKS